MANLFSWENAPMTVLVILVVWSYISFFSVILG
jgi:hypothetical protein